ncbi:MAG TPA: hypothetical protein VH302_00535 [Bryobacteraceae bacterium]|jgi:hypothetical protein|nr:hypothetical protein [Bryobacteraceae bacterium]
MAISGLELLRFWQTFYEIVGSAAAALTGLQFVVIAVLAQSGRPGGRREVSAFGTPTVVNFCAALLIALFMSAPWPGLPQLEFCLTACAAFGLAYSIRVLYHARNATSYKPDAEDWVWYLVLPFLGYATLFSAGILLWMSQVWALAVPAAVAVLFLVIGIHNAWDTLTYIVVDRPDNAPDPGARKE